MVEREKMCEIDLTVNASIRTNDPRETESDTGGHPRASMGKVAREFSINGTRTPPCGGNRSRIFRLGL